MKIYHTETQADYNSLMVELEEQGVVWLKGINPTEVNCWSEFESQTGIKVQDCILTYHGVEYFERANPETPIIKYTAKKETQLPEWANWLARDEDGSLMAFERKPIKYGEIRAWVEPENYGDSISFDETNRVVTINETDDTFSYIKWTDEEPTEVKRGLEATGISVAELNRITNAKAHGYDSVPEVADKTERVHIYRDGTKITVDETTSLSFEDTMALLENDMINQPLHYVGNQGLEVEVVLQNFIPRYADPYVGHRIASAIEYLLRSPLKNQRQDIEKAGKNIQQALAYLDMMEELK